MKQIRPTKWYKTRTFHVVVASIVVVLHSHFLGYQDTVLCAIGIYIGLTSYHHTRALDK